MSHFSVFVLLNSRDDYEEAVKKALAPYDEGLNVDAYQRRCFCFGSELSSLVVDSLDKSFPFDEIREGYWAEVQAKFDKEFETIPEEYWDKIRPSEQRRQREELRSAIEKSLSPSWEERLAPRRALELELKEKHKDLERFDPSCETCSGSGSYPSNYNPKSKWDWWEIGGRWQGMLSSLGYKPREDARNKRKCSNCKGSGKKPVARGEDTVMLFCRDCDGTGLETVDHFSWASSPDWNIAAVSKILDFNKCGERTLPFAFITPEGEWLEKGEMGWFGISANDKEDWDEQALEILNRYKDSYAVLVDCHI